jgi:hypothetical protein
MASPIIFQDATMVHLNLPDVLERHTRMEDAA